MLRNRKDNSRAMEFVLRTHVWLVATMIPLLVKVLSLKHLLGLLTPSGRFHPYVGFSEGRIRSFVRHRLRNPRRMRGRACLREGLTLFHFLSLGGVPAVLRIGAYPPSKTPQRMRAHCWITIDGRPVTDAPQGLVATLVTHTGLPVDWRQGESE